MRRFSLEQFNALQYTDMDLAIAHRISDKVNKRDMSIETIARAVVLIKQFPENQLMQAERDILILKMRFVKGMSARIVGQHLFISAARVFQLQKRALRRVNHVLNSIRSCQNEN